MAEHGFIQGKMEIKFLLLYILSRAEFPLEADQLGDIAMVDGGVSYFDFSDALADLVETEHVLLEDGRYTITEKGRKNGAVTEDELAYSVRLRCEQQLEHWNEAARQAGRVHASLDRLENGHCLVKLSFDRDNAEGQLFALELELPLTEDARQLIRRFQADPQAFYRNLMTL